MLIQLDNKEENDYKILSKLRDKYIKQVNDFVSIKRGNFINGMNNVSQANEKVDYLISNLQEYLGNLLNVLKELPEYFKATNIMLIDEMNEVNYSDISRNTKTLIAQEFEFYFKGIVFSITNEL